MEMLAIEVWNSMSWKERIEHIQAMYGFKTIRELTENLLGGKIKPVSVRMWKTGKAKPGKKTERVLCKYATGGGGLGVPDEQACSALLLDASADCADDLVKYVLAKRNPRQLSGVGHCIACKIADMTMALTGGKAVCKFETTYGRYPYKETITFIPVRKQDIRITVDVTHGEEIDSNFIICLNAFIKGVNVSTSVLRANDYGIAYTANNVNNLLFKFKV